jgi:NagD protein
MGKLSDKKGFICDMDGVIYHGNKLVDGSNDFVNWLKKEGKKFLFLTNSSAKSPKELKNKLLHFGIEIDENHFITSAQATASFLTSQNPNVGVYVIVL